MIRIALILAVTFSSIFAAHAQERPTRDAGQSGTLKANPERDKAAYVASMSPSVSVNGTACKFKDVSMFRNGGGQYSVRIRFEESCAGFADATFNFSSLEEASEVKDLFLNYRSYQSLNITGKKGEPLGFEVVFTHPGRR